MNNWFRDAKESRAGLLSFHSVGRVARVMGCRSPVTKGVPEGLFIHSGRAQWVVVRE
ncbi:hypothetical protein ACVJA9_006992 [Bradyrhizobium diazoefficiens]